MHYRIKVRILCLDMAHREGWMQRVKAEYQEGQAGTEIGFVLTWEDGYVAVFTFPPMSYHPSVTLISQKTVRARQFAGHHEVSVLDSVVARTQGPEKPAVHIPKYTNPWITIN